MRSTFFSIGLGLLFTSCGSPGQKIFIIHFDDLGSDPLTNVRVTGFYDSACEKSCLWVAGSGETWWVDFPEESPLGRDFMAAYEACVKDDPFFVVVDLVGDATELGKFGHLGDYDRDFVVKRIMGVESVPEVERPRVIEAFEKSLPNCEPTTRISVGVDVLR